MRRTWSLVTLAGVAVLGLGTLAFVHTQDAAATQEMQEASAAASREQPVAFPHNIHAGENRIDCAYCHFSAERSKSAGIPSVASCMGCHTVIPGRNNPEEVQKVRDYWERGEPIPWVGIYKISEHAHFPHMRHIAAGVDCTECHGNVQEMGVIIEVAQPLSMGWCIDCHVERDASRDCTVCHY